MDGPDGLWPSQRENRRVKTRGFGPISLVDDGHVTKLGRCFEVGQLIGQTVMCVDVISLEYWSAQMAVSSEAMIDTK